MKTILTAFLVSLLCYTSYGMVLNTAGSAVSSAVGSAGEVQMSNGSGGLTDSASVAKITGTRIEFDGGVFILNNNDLVSEEGYMGIGVNNDTTYQPRIWMGNDNKNRLELIPNDAEEVMVREDTEDVIVSTASIFSVRSTLRGSIPCPPMTTTQRNNITAGNIYEGLMIYNTTTHKVQVSTATGDANSWVDLN